jgi:hypothetical protein
MRQLPKTIAADTWLWGRLYAGWRHAGMQTRVGMWPLFTLAAAHAALWGRLLIPAGPAAYRFWPYHNRLAERFRSWRRWEG